MVILIQCKDRVGLVAAISSVMALQNINIVSMREYVDTNANRFFARFVSEEPIADFNQLQFNLHAVLPADAVINIDPRPEKKLVLLVTKEYHCLSDILIRNNFNTLGATVQCVIGNHLLLKDICNKFQVPFFYVDHTGITKEAFEAQLIDIIEKFPYDYLVLAKFMRILSPEFVQRFPLKIINIHHSFLPAFIGANPYRQAHLRGVKLIGATAHFVTNQLDDGPIIEQQIISINHTFTVDGMIKAGKEIETAVLAKALKMVLEDRVFVYENKTVVFD